MIRQSVCRLAVAGLVAAVAATSGLAADMVFDCSQEHVDRMGTSTIEPFTVTYRGEDTGEISIDGAVSGKVVLPATRQTQGTMVGLKAAGHAPLRLPDKAQVKACYDKFKAANPAGFEGDEINAAVAVSCQSDAALTADPADAAVSVEIAAMGSDVLSVFIERKYADATGPDAALYMANPFPMPSCKLK